MAMNKFMIIALIVIYIMIGIFIITAFVGEEFKNMGSCMIFFVFVWPFIVFLLLIILIIVIPFKFGLFTNKYIGRFIK